MHNTEWRPARGQGQRVSEQVLTRLQSEIAQLRSGARLPSVRSLAKRWHISTHTVVTVYERLIAQGLIESRPYSGFYVRARTERREPEMPLQLAHSGRVDTQWMLAAFMGQNEGAGVPKNWLDHERVLSAVRHVGRNAGSGLLDYGHSHGYAPLRRHIATQLDQAGIHAHPDRQLLLCSGVTHALDLILRHSVKPGDCVLVEEPAWYLVFARLALGGVKVVGVPRLADGPDMRKMEQLVQTHRPVLMIINSVVHNPTGSSLSLAKAHQLLQLAERYDFFFIEDDTFSELHPGSAYRLAQLDQLQRVILVGGYSKVLAAGLRTAYVAANPECIEALVRLKMLSGMTTPELTERVVHRLLSEGQQRRFVQRMRYLAAEGLEQTLDRLAALGLQPDFKPIGGMFAWVNVGCDSESIVKRLHTERHTLVSGNLFFPDQAPTAYLRFSAALADKPMFWEAFRRCLES